MQQEIISRFQMRQAQVAVIGLGYVGSALGRDICPDRL